MSRTLRRDVASLREHLAATISTSVNVLVFDVLDENGHAQSTQGHNVESLRVWVPAADAVELVEAIAPIGLHMLLASNSPTPGFTALPGRDPGESLEDYTERCRSLLP